MKRLESMRRSCWIILFCWWTWPTGLADGAGTRTALFRPPSIPLVTHDPYFSIWLGADRWTDAWPTHWTGRRQALQCMVRLDGIPYRLLGPEPKEAPALEQVQLEVLPTRTMGTFQNEQIQVIFSFISPLLPQNLDLLSRPVTYLTWQVRSLDGQKHRVSLYFEASAELAVNTPEQEVVWHHEKTAKVELLRMGTKEQGILGKKGDDLRIDWGYAYLCAPVEKDVQSAIGDALFLRQEFMAGQPLPKPDDARQPRAAKDGWPAMALAFHLGAIGKDPVSHRALLAYDDLYSINYLGRPLRPYWRRSGVEMAELAAGALRNFGATMNQCDAFDRQLLQDCANLGGEKYAWLVALAYRQTMAGNKLVADDNGEPLLFPKENFSNGCIGTVDVTYPMGPLFLFFGPTLAKAMLVPILNYAESPRWLFPFAPHDLGTYPLATGQVYGGGERSDINQMPVEESGNLLLLVAAVAKSEGKAEFAQRYWTTLTHWAEYLRSKGLDPENQLCTDDFAGHLAHNVNLSAKAILALGAYARLGEMLGKAEEAKTYRSLAESYAVRWQQMADDGDHYRLAFDKPGTWSQKYNLVWDRILGLNLFPPEVARKEMAYYRKNQNRYGLPLDNREKYTKLDWIVWTASLTGLREDFEALVDPVCDFLQNTPSRVPMTDWYWTHTGELKGFQARPVVGGVFIRLLDDQGLWLKWSAQGARTKGNWAPAPAVSQ